MWKTAFLSHPDWLYSTKKFIEFAEELWVVATKTTLPDNNLRQS